MNSQANNIKVECAADCGNSPKKRLLLELSIAFAANDVGFCAAWMTDDVIWNMIGDKRICGKDEFEKAALNLLKSREVSEIHVQNIITHGNTGSINGTLRLKNKKTVAFCEVYNFRGFGPNSKIKEITSYFIQTND